MGKSLNLFDLAGRVAIITGGSRGIGLAIAEGLASAGATSVITATNEERGVKAAGQLRAKGYKSTFIKADVTRRAEVERMVSETLETFHQVDILVNSAGVIIRNPIEKTTDEEWAAMMDVNVRGVFVCSQVVGIEMIKRKRGRIINVSSIVAQVLMPHRGVYAVTKAAVSQLTRAMALEWAPYHVNVNAIAPAPTITELNKKFFDEHPEDLKERIREVPQGRLGEPKDYVGIAVLLASEASDFITGQTIFVDGGSNLI
jgi:2-deoxy-D-gluconate 3-dehydrogenase